MRSYECSSRLPTASWLWFGSVGMAGQGLEGALSKWWVIVYGCALTSVDLLQSQTNNQTLWEIEKEIFWEFQCSHYSRCTGLNKTGITHVAEKYQVECQLCTPYTKDFSLWICAFLQNLYTINYRPWKPRSACIITCWLYANTSTLRVFVTSFTPYSFSELMRSFHWSIPEFKLFIQKNGADFFSQVKAIRCHQTSCVLDWLLLLHHIYVMHFTVVFLKKQCVWCCWLCLVMVSPPPAPNVSS